MSPASFAIQQQATYSQRSCKSNRIRKAVSKSPAPKKAVRFEETGKENIVAVENAKQNKVTGYRIAVRRVVVHENGVVNESAVTPTELHVSAILLACS